MTGDGEENGPKGDGRSFSISALQRIPFRALLYPPQRSIRAPLFPSHPAARYIVSPQRSIRAPLLHRPYQRSDRAPLSPLTLAALHPPFCLRAPLIMSAVYSAGRLSLVSLSWRLCIFKITPTPFSVLINSRTGRCFCFFRYFYYLPTRFLFFCGFSDVICGLHCGDLYVRREDGGGRWRRARGDGALHTVAIRARD